MKITLTKKEALEYFHNALCNGIDYLAGHGVGIIWNVTEYNKAQKTLNAPCYEDVLIQILKDGGELMLEDMEGDYNEKITIQDVYDRVQLTPIDHLNNMINEQDDAITADVILQTVFLKEIIFG